MNCFSCGDDVQPKRWQLGYRVCLACGEVMARAVKHTQLPLNKSNYIYVSPDDTETPKQLNPKRSAL